MVVILIVTAESISNLTVCFVDVNCIKLAQDKVSWLAFVINVMNHFVSWE
jgi:hypothetical protein